MFPSKRMMITALMCCLLVSGGFARAEVVDWIVAKVNDDIILYSEVLERMHSVREAATPPGGSVSQSPSEQDVLRLIIRERLTDQEIKRLKITVGKGEVDRAIDEIKSQNGLNDAQLEYVLGQQGKTLPKFREGIQREIERARLIERVFKSKAVITDEQLDAYLQKSGGGPQVKERRRLAVIFLPVPDNADKDSVAEVEERAKKIHNSLASGADFAKLAREHSKGPGAESGGDIGFISSDELAPPIEEATKGLKPGSITKVVTMPTGCYIFKALDVQKESTNTADAGSREKARRQLVQEEINRRFEKWINDLEARSFIQVHTKPAESLEANRSSS